MKVFAPLLLLLLLASSAFAQAPLDRDYVKQLYNATGLLYGQDESGTMRMRCTVTAIDKDERVIRS